MEEGLSAAFRFAEKWKAVALLDEADVFLEQRRDSDLARNGLITGMYSLYSCRLDAQPSPLMPLR